MGRGSGVSLLVEESCRRSFVVSFVFQVIKHVELSPTRRQIYSELEGYRQQAANSQHQFDECQQLGVS